MAERRAMGEAMAISPEKMAFIQGGSGAAKAEPAPVRRQEVVAPVHVSTEEQAVEPREASPRPSRRRPAASERRKSPQEDRPFIGQILIPLTTRLQPDTANALRRACLEQKLAGRQPATQQEIVEAAVRTWLAAEEYL